MLRASSIAVFWFVGLFVCLFVLVGSAFNF